MANKKDPVQKADLVKRAAETLHHWGDTMTQYLDTLDNLPEFELKAGNYYRTINGSTVQVSRPYEECTCGVCMTRRAMAGNSLLSMLMQTPSEPEEEDEGKMPTDHKKAECFVIQVLAGGHGNDKVPGKEPGSSYVLSRHGRLDETVLKVINISETMFDSDLFSILGMVPKTRLKAVFTDND